MWAYIPGVRRSPILWASRSVWVAGLTVMDHRHPSMQLAVVEHAIKLATLGVAERGLSSRAGWHIADTEPLPLPHTVLASVLRPVKKAVGL